MADDETATAPSGDDWKAQLAQLPELADEDLAALEGTLVESFDAADQAGDEASLTELADALDLVRAEIAKRSEAPSPEPVAADGAAETAVVVEPVVAEDVVAEAEQITAEAAAEDQEEAEEMSTDTDTGALPADVIPTEAEPETVPLEEDATDQPEAQESEEDEDNKEGTTVAATASGTVAVPRKNAPVVASAPNSVVVAGADIPGFSAGYEFQNSKEFGSALAARINTQIRVNGGNGEKVLIASIRTEADKARTLNFNDPEGNAEKIEALTHIDSITAAGGCCAPLTTRYDLFDCGGVTDRPVRDALAGFQADRGGIRYFSGPSLGDLGGAVGFWTCTDDEDSLTDPDGPVKACTRIDCPPEQTAEIQAVTLCLTFGVMASRVFPEVAVANNKLAMVAHSRIAEAALLAQIKLGSKAITDSGTPLSAVRDLLDTIGRAAMYYRDRYRLNKNMPLRVIFPVWVLELLRGDIAWGEPVGSLRQTLSVSDVEIEGFFKDRNINVTWALDSATPGTNGGGFFIDATTSLPAWPTSVQWAMYPEGSWLYLDGGSLDLGVIRDSGLVKTNDYMQFSEVFEAAANIGCESLWITSTVNVSGRYNGPIPGVAA